MAEINEEYEIGFKDGLKSKIGDELLPMIEQILVGVSDAVKSVIPLMIDRMEIKANLDSNDWIPCSERLPEDNTTVLYVWRSENGNVSVFHGWHSSIRGLGGAWHQSGVGMQRPEDEVTHWMPLPEPPKIGGTDNVDS